MSKSYIKSIRPNKPKTLETAKITAACDAEMLAILEAADNDYPFKSHQCSGTNDSVTFDSKSVFSSPNKIPTANDFETISAIYGFKWDNHLSTAC